MTYDNLVVVVSHESEFIPHHFLAKVVESGGGFNSTIHGRITKEMNL